MLGRASTAGFCCILALTTCLNGQGYATLSGSVQDTTGGVIPQVFLILWNQETGLNRTTYTDDSGAYRFPQLPPGVYELSVSAPGFRKLTRPGVRLHVSDRVALDVILQIGRVEEAITVSGAEEATTAAAGTLRRSVEQKRIDYLPLNRRDAIQFITTQAGVVARSSSVSEGTGYAVNGNRQSGVHYTLDGGSNTDSYRNWSGVFPNASAIEEISVERSSLSAEYGNSVGAVVSVITKSGTNDVHGSAFEFLRNGVFNARDFFASRRDNLKRSQFGATLGGPVVRHRLFFFGSYQGTRLRSEPQLTLQYLPTRAMRTGDFSALARQLTDPLSSEPFPGSHIPRSRLNPVTQTLLRYIAVPETAPGERWIGVQDRTAEDEYTVRLDSISTSHHITGRYFYRSLRAPFSGNVNDLASMSSPTVSKSTQPYSHGTMSHIWLISPRLINNGTAAIRARRTLNDWSAIDLPIDFARAGVQGIATKNPASMYLSVAGNFLARPGWNYEKRDLDFHFADTLTWVTGRHELKIGGDHLRIRNVILNDFRTMGNFEFTGAATGDSMADFLLGDVYQFWQGGGEYKDLRGSRTSLFLQEDWRAIPSLTVNAGLRWEPVVPYRDTLGRTQCFRPGMQSTRFVNAPVGYLNAGDPGCPEGGFESYRRSFAPRFGFAWRPPGTSLVIRGGAGIFWIPQFTILYNGFVNSAPFSPQVTLNGVSFERPYAAAPNPFPGAFAPFQPPADVGFSKPLGQFGSFSPSFQPGYSESVNLTMEHGISGGWTSRVSYVANLGKRLSYTYDANYARYTPEANMSNLQQRRPDTNFAGILIGDSGSTSSYHALELAMVRRAPAGLSVEVNYAWSKAIDDTSDEARPGQSASMAVPFDRKAGRAVADFDVRQQLVASWVWALPRLVSDGWISSVLRDWAVAGIASLRTGMPFSVRSGTDRALSGVGQDFVDILGNPHLDSDRPKSEVIARYFDTAAFEMAAKGTFGNAPRNLLRAPGAVNFDLAVVRSFSVGDRLETQVRAESFNAMNHVNLGAPFAVVNNPARFGRIESAAAPRTIQVAMKLVF